MAPSKRDAETLLAAFRERYPMYKDTDDATLLSAIKKKYPQYNDVNIGNIPHSENLLQKVINRAGLFVPQSKDEAVDVARIAGRQLPMGEGGEVSPATMGPFGAGLNIAGIKEIGGIPQPSTEWGGEMEQFVDRASIAVPAALGGKALLKKGAEIAFPKTMAKMKLPGKTKELSSSIQKVFKLSKNNPELGVPKDMVIAKLEEGLSKSKVPSGEQASLFKKWIRALKTDPKFGDKLDAETISEIETKFGKVAKWGKGVNDPILQNSAKDVNRYASAKLDEIATKAGVPEFIKKSQEKSKLLKTISTPKSKIRKLAELALGGAVTGAGGTLGYKAIKSIMD